MIRRLLLLLATAFLFHAAPALAAPCAGFIDVDSADPFCDEVTWIKNRGVTLGCTANQYCPNSDVTRLQMALFMFRLGDTLFPSTCTAGQVMKWNGNAWACAADATAGGGGTVSSVTAGTGLTGGTITSSGTIAVDAAYVQRRVSTSCAPGSSIRAIAADGSVTCETDDVGATNAFVQGGNAFGAAARLGTTDNQDLQLIVNNVSAMRLAPHAISPNVLAGHSVDTLVSPDVYGATISGGGTSGVSYQGLSCVQFFGCRNGATDHFGFIGGGAGNTVGNAAGSPTDAHFGTIGGGFGNYADNFGFVGGGNKNMATDFGVVTGGTFNSATNLAATVVGGEANQATGMHSTVLGGASNIASGNFSIAAGSGSTADGSVSFAWGVNARAMQGGCVVFSDNSALNPTSCLTANQFFVRAKGGIYLITGGANDLTYTGAQLLPGTSGWVAYSDRDGKEEITAVDSEEVLRKVAAIPLSTWQWKSEPGAVRHMGPMAQDFHSAFGLGTSDKHISTVDADGVALAAIQGLNAKLEAGLAAKARELDELRAELADLRALRDEVAKMKAELSPGRPRFAARAP